ncbi:lytic polysaccharide monooxygenase auxiliary activity family 9 protein [Salininema proteolyticum]|uniref:Lytic polysaccharide monooxygenase n=1 Tax=Salininema proteolyticum TaxID=1607685 RepID=A0ABV8U4G1_9ACTN
MRKKLATLAVSAGAVVGALAVSAPASAHGWVTDSVGDVESRSGFCAEGVVSDCGGIQYEPQSLEAPKGFPEAGPQDGSLCGIGAFPALDDQRGGAWPKNEVSGGSLGIGWNYTAAHATSKWEYYITKDGWNPDEPLTRAQLEPEPFATFDGGGQRPPFQHVHDVNLPAKQGYHMVYAVWEIADTANSFYNCIDLQFGGDDGGPGDEDPPGDGDPQPGTCDGISDWSTDATYLGGDQVAFNGELYTAKWWTRGDEPGASGQWGVWESNGPC